MKIKEMITTKSVLLSFSLLLFIACTGYSNEGKTPTIEKTFTVETPGSLDVKTSGGGISVQGTAGNNVEVLAFVRKNGRLLDSNDPIIQNLNEGFEIIIEKHGNTIVATANKLQRSMPWKQISVSFHVTLPYNMACNIKTSGGSIKISDVNGIQTAHTSGGGIKLNNINGNTKAYTSGGSIKVDRIKGHLDIHTSGGGISIRDSEGKINASTSGGSIHLENIYGSVESHTSGGGIHISGTANSVRATTSGGSIHADITGLSQELFLETSGGSIHAKIPRDLGLEVDLKGNRVDTSLNNFSGTMKKDRVSGTMNGGGIPLHIHTSGGNVSVDFI